MGGFTFLSQHLPNAQQREEWRTEERRWKAKRRWKALSELEEAVQQGIFSLSSKLLPADLAGARLDDFYFEFLARMREAVAKAWRYLDPATAGDRGITSAYAPPCRARST